MVNKFNFVLVLLISTILVENIESKKMSSAVVLTSLTMRSMPDVKSEKVICYIYDRSKNAGASNGFECADGGCYKDTKYIPKGNILKILERSKSKVKVGKWNNYWYRVEPAGRGKSRYELSCDMGTVVWVYGEFLKKKK